MSFGVSGRLSAALTVAYLVSGKIRCTIPHASPYRTRRKGSPSYLDNLKVWLTFLVVAHHVAQAYGPTGGAWPVSEPMRSPYLAPFITINAMFFMGLFFFISRLLYPGAYQRKGFRPLRD
ncbi:MAG: acyltransferase family protein [Armatimonas sp.]